MRKIKLVWDFYGGDARGTAEHHIVHLKQFMMAENHTALDYGVEETIDMHQMATMTVEEKVVDKIKNKLKPHRAFVVA